MNEVKSLIEPRSLTGRKVNILWLVFFEILKYRRKNQLKSSGPRQTHSVNEPFSIELRVALKSRIEKREGQSARVCTPFTTRHFIYSAKVYYSRFFFGSTLHFQRTFINVPDSDDKTNGQSEYNSSLWWGRRPLEEFLHGLRWGSIEEKLILRKDSD